MYCERTKERDSCILCCAGSFWLVTPRAKRQSVISETIYLSPAFLVIATCSWLLCILFLVQNSICWVVVLLSLERDLRSKSQSTATARLEHSKFWSALRGLEQKRTRFLIDRCALSNLVPELRLLNLSS
jgi:hypothetical protein